MQVSEKTVEISQLQTAEKIVDTRETQMIQGILTGAMKPDDDPDARIKFLAEEELCRVGDPVFDTNGNLVANELRRRDCVMGEMRKNKPPFRVALNRAASDEIARHCKHCTEREVTKLHESGTALAEGMRVPVSKMEELIAAHCQASLKTVKNPNRRPYPAYPSSKSWCEACGKTGSGKKFHHNVMSGVDFAAQHCSSQGTQQPHNKNEDVKRQREKEEERKGEKGREENGRKSEAKGVRKEDEEGDSKVVKDATGWTVVTRNKRQRKMVQIFVKVDEAKVTPMDVSLTDGKIEDVIRQVQKGEDVYVTMQGKVLRRNEKLKSCGVTDGCTIQVTSRMRGGGKHQDKKSKAEKQAASAKTPEQKVTDGKEGDRGPATQECDLDAAIRMIEENEDSRKMTESMSEGSDEDMERTLQNCRTAGYEVLGWSQEQVEMMERGLRWAVEARRKGRQQQEEEPRRRGEQGHHLGQEQSKQGKHMRCGDEEQFEEAEVRTGRGSAGLVRGRDERCRADETNRKGKGKGNGGKGEHEGKGGGFGHKGKHPETREREEERVRMAPNMGAGGSHPQATSDPGKEEKEKKETRVLSWADCNDEEAKENEEEVEEEKKMGQREMTDERPPGLEEEVENELKTQQEEKPSQVESEHEAQEEERRRAEKSARGARGAEKSAGGARRAEESAGGARGTEESAGCARGKEGSGGARKTGERGQGSGARERSECSRGARKRSEGSRGARRACQEGKGSGGANGARERS